MATIKVNYDALQHTATDLSDESKRIFKLALEIERTMTKIPMKTTSQSLAKLKMARQCIGLTSASAKLMKFAVNLGEIGNVYKDADHRILVGGDDLEYAKYLNNNANGELSEDDVRRIKKFFKDIGETVNDKVTDIKEYVIHYWNIYSETDFSKMSYDDLKSYFNDFSKRINENGLSNDDYIRLKALYNYLSKGSFGDKELYFDVFAMINSDEANHINECINSKGYSGDKAEWIKYFMTKGTSLKSAEILYQKWTNKKNIIADMKILSEAPDKTEFKQGNFHIGDISVSKNSDGSCDLSLSAKQTSAAKSYGALIVYDAEGHVKEIKVLDRYHNPTNPIEACKTIWKDWHNEDYSETNVNVTVPKGGYVQITDDPNEISIIQTGKMGEELVTDQIKDIVKKEVGDYVKKKTGIGQVGKHATDTVKYRAKVITEAKEAYEITKKSAEIMDKIEDVYWSAEQKGSGAAIIFND